MVFHRDGSRVVSESSKIEYQSRNEFLRVLHTLPSKEIPQAMVLLGILAEQLEPVEQGPDKHTEIVKKEPSQVPPAEVPEQTVNAVMWFLHKVRHSINEDRKQKIGRLVSKANLNEPAETANSAQTQATSAENLDPTQSNPNTHEMESAEDSISRQGNERDPTEMSSSSDKQNTVTTESEGHTQGSGSKYKYSKSGKIFECEFCSKRVESKNKLISHSVNCDKRPTSAQAQCEYCGNKYVSAEALSEHLKSCGQVNNTNKFTCSNCGKKLDSHGNLLVHRQSCGSTQSASAPQRKKGIIEQNVTGSIVYYNSEEGYGFIDSPGTSNLELDGSEDIFFHVTEHPDDEPKENKRVKFDIKKSNEGVKAVNIRYAGPSQTETWDDTFASKRPRWGKDT